MKYNDLRLIKETDMIIVPICLLLMWVFAYFIRKKYKGTPIFGYFFPALMLRFLFAFVYALVIQFYYGAGDTSMFYQAVQDMQNALEHDASYWQEIYFSLKLDPNSPIYPYFLYDSGGFTNYYMQHISNYMVPRFALPFSVMFFRSYPAICFCLSLYSFAGCWRIFKMFYEMYPHLKKKLAIAILFLPSILFWGGSLLKDSICMGSLGFALYAAYQIFLKKRKITSSLIILVLAGMLLYYTKPYILLCLVPAFSLLLFLQFKNRIQDKTLRKIAAFLFAMISLVVGFYALQALTQSEIAAQYSSDKLLQTVRGVQGSFGGDEEGSGSSFTVGNVTGSALGMISLFPLGLIATLFRPFLWEARNPLMILSALESVGFLYLTFVAFKRIGVKKFFNLGFSDPVIVFCMVYSLLFAGIIGITTTNFGALVRYKIPCIPFYLFMLFIIMDKSGKFSRNIVFHKKFF